jgi:arylsulfatase
MYLAYTAPHFPLHAKRGDIEKYRGLYLSGWDSLRVNRYQRMAELGIRDETWKLTDPMPDVRPWAELGDAEKIEFDRRMAVYAAQIDIMDQGVGRVISTLEELGIIDNTVIFFLSDNGGTAEYISRGSTDIHLIGTEESYESYRKPWATVSNTPFRFFKQWVHEGGISTPLIVHWPDGIEERGTIRHQVGHVIDLMPTCMELADAPYPETYMNRQVLPYEGQSLVASFNDHSESDRLLFWEHQATRAIRKGDWKLVANRASNVKPYVGPWELYNLRNDRSETVDLSGDHPEIVRELDSLWNDWALRCQVYPLDGRGWFERLE